MEQAVPVAVGKGITEALDGRCVEFALSAT
jgi:hypothetical protein